MRLTRLLPAFLAVCLAKSASGSLQDALIARHVLADVAQTCVVRLEFEPGAAVKSPVYAMAFALENVFWVYAPEIGTRVLGPATKVWPDTATLSSRLHAFDASVARVTIYANPVTPDFKQGQLYLNNACVIGSLHALMEVLDREGRVTEAGLILMSYDTADAATAAALQVNHSLLTYRVRNQWWCVDPNHPEQPFPLRDVDIGKPLDPGLVALTLRHSYPVKSVCLLPLSPSTLKRIVSNVQWRTPPLSE